MLNFRTIFCLTILSRPGPHTAESITAAMRAFRRAGKNGCYYTLDRLERKGFVSRAVNGEVSSWKLLPPGRKELNRYLQGIRLMTA